MSLPQRKKSAEEIAKLRESLGIVGPPPAVEELPAEIPMPEPAPAPVVVEPVPALAKAVPEPVVVEETPAVSPLAPLPVGDAPEPKPVRSLKRSERIPVLPVEESGPPHEAHHPEPTQPMPTTPPLPAPHGSKIVRSLRKSEQGPLPPVHEPAPDSKLPIHRHSDREISEIRRQEAIAKTAAPVQPLALTAHLVLVIPGYLAAIAGGACFYFYDIEKREMPVTAGCVVVALAIAAFIFYKKPLSRHHAAFIAVMSLFVIVFGALYYFPNLQHGT